MVKEDFSEKGKELASWKRGRESLCESSWAGWGRGEKIALWVNGRCPVCLKLIVLTENSVSEIKGR